jgi:pyruvate dehydrogenase E1 component
MTPQELMEQIAQDRDPLETQEWIESLEDVLQREGPERVGQLLIQLQETAYRYGVKVPFTANTPYINTIPKDEQPPYPGNREIERRIKNIIRWNAMLMVSRANHHTNVGGHISTYASSATLYEVAQNHFLHGKGSDFSGDQVYFQGHASPGMYARAFVEGRLSEEHLKNFRQELEKHPGLSSYPHPWLMPDFWEFPTVSMGLGPINSIYQARFNRYLQDRGLKDTTRQKVWAFVGDGETDEPETLGAINLAVREKLDNLIWVVNCNLQRLDGPVRGNGKIIQELERVFRGAGWNVIKVLWGGDWDPILAADDGELVRRMGEVPDGQYQKYSVADGTFVRQDFFNSPKLQSLVAHLSDEQIKKIRRGGHDPEKVYAAYKAAVEHQGSPTVILAKTIKGYGLGESGEGRNIAHNNKKLNEQETREFRTRFGIPVSDDQLPAPPKEGEKEDEKAFLKIPFYRPAEDSPEIKYLKERRQALGGYTPDRSSLAAPLAEVPSLADFDEALKGSGGREVSTTMAYVSLFSKLLKDKNVGKLIVPIIPDEARTFGMDGLFRQVGIYASQGQLYEPVDKENYAYYREAKDGQILEEGINEAGSMSSFVAAGTAYASHGINMIPFYIYYSMFGFQRVGDQIWLAADSRAKGFLLGGTAGRTTLNGEGLQHEDGHSHLAASTIPNLRAYDPAFAFEIAVIFQDGIKRMYQDQENIFYYVTLHNENYAMPPIPGDQAKTAKGIIQGMYRFASEEAKGSKARVQLLGSGAIFNSALKASKILAEKYQVSSDVWSVTSYKELRREALAARRWNLLHPDQAPKSSYLEETLKSMQGPIISSSDNVRLVAEQIAPWTGERMFVLGTDGFGRSETREALRRFFEVDAESIVLSALTQLSKQNLFSKQDLAKAVKDLGIDPEKLDPTQS